MSKCLPPLVENHPLEQVAVGEDGHPQNVHVAVGEAEFVQRQARQLRVEIELEADDDVRQNPPNYLWRDEQLCFNGS